jgi:hypothetical protein
VGWSSTWRFARPQAAEEVLGKDRGEGGEGRAHPVDRDGLRERLLGWTAQGLLQPAATGVPAPARLSLFARAVEEFYAGPARRFPLRSAFALQRPVVSGARDA